MSRTETFIYAKETDTQSTGTKESVRTFPQFFHVNSVIVPRLGYDHFFAALSNSSVNRHFRERR
jgi:hypothetical protein